MTLAERIAARILSDSRLRGVPAPVVEEVLAQGFRALAEIVPMKTPASEIDAIEFDACEGCGHLIDPAEPEGARMDSEGIWLCNACVVEEAQNRPYTADEWTDLPVALREQVPMKLRPALAGGPDATTKEPGDAA